MVSDLSLQFDVDLAGSSYQGARQNLKLLLRQGGGDILFSNLEQKSQDFSLRVQGLAYTAYTLNDNNNASNHTSDLIKIPCMI